MAYKAIIFDVGDTLLEHYPSENQIYIDRVKHLGFSVNNELEAKIAEAITTAAHEQIQKEQDGESRMSDDDFTIMLDKAALSCVDNNNKDELLSKLRSVSIPEQKLKIIPGILEVLQAITNKGYRLGIVSNHRKWLPEFLKEIGLACFFELIIVSDVVGVEKPDVRIMHLVLNELNLPASSCLYVGDHPFDVLCAKNAGLDCAWLTPSNDSLPDSIPYKEDFKIQKLQEILIYI